MQGARASRAVHANWARLAAWVIVLGAIFLPLIMAAVTGAAIMAVR